MPASLEQRGDNHFAVQGELNFASVVGLWQESERLFPNHSNLTIDLTGISRSDSSGVALLVEWLRLAKQRQQSVQFSHIPTQMQAIIQVADLTKLLPAVR
ncbi:MAG: STAS domain-containing protein [Candidatus Competibacteraceae bacterium]|jgi:phospholipid transport system transporter-binding protein|nr:STAS domain-containing protein [Candidatus Competibacteraceae bacterium]